MPTPHAGKGRLLWAVRVVLLLVCLAVDAKMIHSHTIPRIPAGVAHDAARIDPSSVERYDPHLVYDRVALDPTPRPGDAAQGWADPRARHGSFLDVVGNGFREPINAIISGHSDSHVLSEQGLLDYVRSIGFSFECLHIHLGGLQHANLGDGNGWTPQLFEYRSLIYPGSLGVWFGACWESLAGGNHFRVWKQNGTLANTGAWFLAVSKEEVGTPTYPVGRRAAYDRPEWL